MPHQGGHAYLEQAGEIMCGLAFSPQCIQEAAARPPPGLASLAKGKLNYNQSSKQLEQLVILMTSKVAPASVSSIGKP